MMSDSMSACFSGFNDVLCNAREFGEIDKCFAEIDEDEANKQADEKEMLEYMVQVEKLKNDKKYNICCDNTMQLDTEGIFVCSICGCIKQNYGDITHSHSMAIMEHIMITGTNINRPRPIIFCGVSDYERVQAKYIMDILLRMQNESRNIKFSYGILNTSRNLCQKVQKTGVYRTKVLREILATCINYACIDAGISYKASEIAAFMQLEKKGFSRGESILRDLHSKGVIDIKVNCNPMHNFINRFFNILKLDEKYKPFVIEIIEAAEANEVARTSIMESKCVGAIWLLIQSIGADKSAKELDDECNVRRNTFYRFCTEVSKCMRFFTPIYSKHELDFKNVKKSKGPRGKRGAKKSTVADNN